MKNEIVNKMVGTIHRAGFQLKKHSPEILIVAGVIGVVTSAVMACKATTKLPDILDKANESLDKIHECVEDSDGSDEYSEEDYKKDTTIVYLQTGVKIAKLYAPAIAIGVLSLSSIVASNNILRQRNVALAAAYTAIDKGFKDYRSCVVERFGNEVDYKLRHNIKATDIEEKVIDEEGNEKTITKTVDTVDPNQYSDFARFFDQTNPNWEERPEFNLMFLKKQQQYANDLLRVRGYLFLNEVYDMLGIERTKAGQVVGWLYDEKCPIGDNFVDFGIYDQNSSATRNFVNGYEPVILLDFNVDGNIWEKM
jgi:hypothetical protein